MKLWRADTKQLKPVLVDCPRGGYPADDADGIQIYENTHFDTEIKAWDRLRSEAAAGVSLAACDVEEGRRRLDKAHVRAAEAAVEFKRVQDNYMAWQSDSYAEEEPCDE